MFGLCRMEDNYGGKFSSKQDFRCFIIKEMFQDSGTSTVMG